MLKGEVELRTEAHGPVRLKVGESVYFGSRIGHAYLNVGVGPARIVPSAGPPPKDVAHYKALQDWRCAPNQ